MSNNPNPLSVNPEQPSARPTVRFEPRDVDVRVILISLAVLGLLVVATLLGLWPVFGYLSSLGTGITPPAAPSLMSGRSEPPEPRLQGGPGHQISPQEELREMGAEANARLNSYGWVDRPCAVAHIPIQEAMKLLAEGKSVGGPAPPRDSNCTAGSAPAASAESDDRRKAE